MPADDLTAIFAALADPTRRAILARLAGGEATVNELAAAFEVKLPTVSKHLKVLQRAGLISQSKRAQWRPCHLETAPLKHASGWVDRYVEMYEERFARLDDYLRQLKEKEDEGYADKQ